MYMCVLFLVFFFADHLTIVVHLFGIVVVVSEHCLVATILTAWARKRSSNTIGQSNIVVHK